MNAIIESVETPKQAAHRLATATVKGPFTAEALHVYRDRDGNAAYCRWRVRKGDGDKVIRPMHWDGAAWAPGEPAAPRDGKLLYRLPEVLAADADAVVVIVEGEWCADALHKLNLIVTTSGSASSAHGADWTPLRGRHCLIWPDHDEPGMKYAADVADKLHGLGCAVRLVAAAVIEALPANGDVVDWLAMHPGATAADVLALATVEKHAPRAIIPYVDLIVAKGMKPEPIRWIFPGYLARGKFIVLAGAPGTGKTTIAIHYAGCITSGAAFPDGSRPVIGNVLIWSGEDDFADTLVPRLIAAGADLARVHFVGDTREDGQRRPFDPARDVDLLAAAAANIGDVRLLIVDPVVSAVSGDSHKNAEVRRGLAPLVDLAARLDAALLGITHYSKGTGGRDPLERVTGSLAFGALARVVLGTVRMEAEEGQPQKLMLARAKSNIGPDGGGFVYAFEQIELEAFPGVSASRIVWGAAVEGTARELLAEPEPDSGRESPSRDEAAEWLRELLEAGPVSTDEIRADVKAAGFTWATVRRAKDAIGAKSKKSGFADSRWFWMLPEPRSTEDAPATLHPVDVSTFANGEHLRPTARVSEGIEGAQNTEGAEGAHLPRVNTLGEHLPVSGVDENGEIIV